MNFYKVKGFWLFRMKVTSAKPKLQLKCKRKTSFSFISTQLLCLQLLTIRKDKQDTALGGCEPPAARHSLGVFHSFLSKKLVR